MLYIHIAHGCKASTQVSVEHVCTTVLVRDADTTQYYCIYFIFFFKKEKYISN